MDAKVLIALGIISKAIEAEERLVKKATHLNVLREEVYMNSLRNASTEELEEEDLPGITVDTDEVKGVIPGVTVDAAHVNEIDADFDDIVQRARSDHDDDDDDDDDGNPPENFLDEKASDDQQISDLDLESDLDLVQHFDIVEDDNEGDSDDDNSSGELSRDERELRQALQSLDNGDGKVGGVAVVDEDMGDIEVLKDAQKDVTKEPERKAIPILNLSAVSSPSRIKPVQSPVASETQNLIEKDVLPLAARRGFQNRIVQLDFAYQDEEQKYDSKADFKSPSDLIIRSLNTQSTRSDGSMDDKLDHIICEEKEYKLHGVGLPTPQGLGQGKDQDSGQGHGQGQGKEQRQGLVVLGSGRSILSPESARYEQKLSARSEAKQASSDPQMGPGRGSGSGSELGLLGDCTDNVKNRIEEKRSVLSPVDSTIARETESESAAADVHAGQSDFDENYMKAQALLAMLEEADDSRAEGGGEGEIGPVHSSSSADTLPQSPTLPELSPFQSSADAVLEMRKSQGSMDFIRSSIRSSFSLPGELQINPPAMHEGRDERVPMDRMEESDEMEESGGHPLTPERHSNAALWQIYEDDDGGEDEEKERDIVSDRRADMGHYPLHGLSREEVEEEDDGQAQEREALRAELSLCRQRIEERKKNNLVSNL
jgi:hypothetical protein